MLYICLWRYHDLQASYLAFDINQSLYNILVFHWIRSTFEIYMKNLLSILARW